MTPSPVNLVLTILNSVTGKPYMSQIFHKKAKKKTQPKIFCLQRKTQKHKPLDQSFPWGLEHPDYPLYPALGFHLS